MGELLKKKQKAVIEKVDIFIEDHGILTSFLYMKMDSGGQGFGGYNLGKSLTDNTVYLRLWKKRCCEVAGVSDFNNLKDKQVYIYGDFGQIDYIESLNGSDFFNPAKEFAILERMSKEEQEEKLEEYDLP